MKKYLIRIAIFFVLIITIDFLFGKIMFYAESKSYSKNYHCMYKANEDILILGSSFAARSIVPSVIEDSLNLSCYNAGEPGNGSLAAWARYNMFIKNHTPKLIIYTLTPAFDYVKQDEYSKYLNTIKPYYRTEESVTNMYHNLMDWTDSFILYSNLVKFNSYCAQLIYHWFSKKSIGLQGYDPLYETFTPYENENEQTINKYKIDKPKMNYLEQLFDDAKKKEIPIICLLPPYYHKNINLSHYKEGFEICNKYDIPIINHTYYEGISQDAQYFYDIAHLNDKGAKFYTGILCKELQTLLKSK